MLINWLNERRIGLVVILACCVILHLHITDQPFEFWRQRNENSKSIIINLNKITPKGSDGNTKPLEIEAQSSGDNISFSVIKFKLEPLKFNDESQHMVSSGDAILSKADVLQDHPRRLHNSTNCYDLVSGDDIIYEREIKHASDTRKSELLLNFDDKSLANLAGNCTRLRWLLSADFAQVNRTIDNEYTIAYSILVDRSAEQTLTLIRSIYSPNNLYCLHVDKNADEDRRNFVFRLSKCYPNIFLPKRRYKLTAQTVTRLYAVLSCFKTLTDVRDKPWKFLINIPGAAFPLRNNTNIIEYLKTREYINEISSRLPNSVRFQRRTGYVHVLREYHGSTYFLRTRKRKTPPPVGITLFRGEESFIATHEFCLYVLTEQIPKELLLWSHDTKNPEEFYWASLHRYPHAPGGAPYRNEEENYLTETSTSFSDETEDVTGVPDTDVLATLWKSDGSHLCAGEYRNNLCTFGGGDLKWLVKQDKLFATSFDMNVDRRVIDCLRLNLQRPLVEDYHFQLKGEVEYI